MSNKMIDVNDGNLKAIWGNIKNKLLLPQKLYLKGLKPD